MANKSFGTKQLDLTGASGSPIITSPSDLSINATTVAISTNISVGGYFSSNVNVGTGYSIGIGTTIPVAELEVKGDIGLSGSIVPTGNIFAVKTSGSERLRITSDGDVGIGTTGRTFGGDTPHTPALLISGNDYNKSTLALINNAASNNGSYIFFGKQRSGDYGGSTILQDNDNIGQLRFLAADGNDLNSSAAAIEVQVDGTVGGNDTPGRIKFLTTPSGSNSPTERLRIDSDGKVLVGVTSAQGSRSNTSTRYPFVQLSSAWDGGRGTGSFTCTDDYPILFINSNATYQDNAGAGTLTFSVKDGAGNYCNTASIRSQIDGTPGNNDSPGDLQFMTTPDGSANPTAVLTLTARGDVVCNGSPAYFQLPRVNTVEKTTLSGMVGGEMVYDTDQNAVYFYQDTVGWRQIQHSA